MRYPILLAVLLALSGCNEDTPSSRAGKSSDSARIEKEVTRRVEAARLESTVHVNRLQTIRLIGLTALAGGAVGGLVWLRHCRPPTVPSEGALRQRKQPPHWRDHYPTHAGRVIDFPANTANRSKRDPTNPKNHTP